MVMLATKVMGNLDRDSDLTVEMFREIVNPIIAKFPNLNLTIATDYDDETYIILDSDGYYWGISFCYSENIKARWYLDGKWYVNFPQSKIMAMLDRENNR